MNEDVIESRGSPERSDIRGLTGLRAVAAVMVFAFHAWNHAGRPTPPWPGNSWWPYLMEFGASGVALFFTLSGFLLSLPFWRALRSPNHVAVDLARFFRRRALRILPAYLVAVTVYALFHDVDHPLGVRFVHVIAHLLMVHNLSEVTIYSLSAPLWSVATEFQLYALLPLLFVAVARVSHFGRRPHREEAFVFILGGLVSAGAFWFLTWIVSHVSLDPRIVAPGGLVLFHSPLSGLALFAAGVSAGGIFVVCEGLSSRGAHRIGWAADLALPVMVLFAVLMVATGRGTYGLAPTGWPLWPALYAAGVLLVALSRSKWGIAAVLETAPVAFLGTVSYSFYLFHDLVLWNVFNRLAVATGLDPTSDAITLSLLSFVITTLVAWLSYAAIERRLTARIRRLSGVRFSWSSADRLRTASSQDGRP